MYTFTKDERLRKHNLILKLFAEGKTFRIPPFRITWLMLESQGNSPVEILLSVPKYNLRKAVQRNRVRRRMKEAFRLHKRILHETIIPGQKHMLLCLTYTSKEILPFDHLKGKIILLLQRLKEESEKVTG